jgi:hypothetical protein
MCSLRPSNTSFQAWALSFHVVVIDISDRRGGRYGLCKCPIYALLASLAVSIQVKPLPGGPLRFEPSKCAPTASGVDFRPSQGPPSQASPILERP